MFKTCALVASLLAVLMLPWGLQAAPIFKCTSNGAVTYQSDPCPPDVPVKKPTVEQLNAQRQKKPSMPTASLRTLRPSGPWPSLLRLREVFPSCRQR